jgi:hypothetical protein
MTDEAILEAFWNTKRPPRVGPPPMLVPMGAPTCSITCRVCGKRDNIAIDWSGLVCCVCRGDIAGSRARLERLLAALPSREEAAHEAWNAVQIALDDATANRLSLMLADRDRAEAIWKRAGVAKARGNAEPADAEREAKAALEAVLAKIERTTAKFPEMRPVFAAEQKFRKEIAAIKAARAALEIGLQELDAASDEAPF